MANEGPEGEVEEHEQVAPNPIVEMQNNPQAQQLFAVQYQQQQAGHVEAFSASTEQATQALATVSSAAPPASSVPPLAGFETEGPPMPTPEPSAPPLELEASQINMGAYHEKFPIEGAEPQDFSNTLAELMEQQFNKSPGSSFNDRVADVADVLEFVREGAKQDMQADPGNSELQERFKRVNDLYNKMVSIEALARDKTRYTQEQYDKMLQEMDIKEGKMKDALDAMMKDNLYSKDQLDSRFSGNRAFHSDTSKDMPSTRRRGDLQITHSGDSVVGHFNYSRGVLLGTRPFYAQGFTTAAVEKHALMSQAKRLATVALNEYGKGTESSPINIRFTGKEKLHEAAIATLTEFKLQAIERGITLHAIDANGNKFEITPNKALSEDEKKAFDSYNPPAVSVMSKHFGERASKSSAVEQLYGKYQKDESGNVQKYDGIQGNINERAIVRSEGKEKRLAKGEEALIGPLTKKRTMGTTS